MGKISQKKNFSSMQVLKTLQVLLHGNYSMQELLKILNKDEVSKPFNNSVVSKYINTCRYIGMKIPKINNKYIVTDLPFGFDLNYIDIDILKELHFAISKELSPRNSSIFKSLLEKINRFSQKDIAKVDAELCNSSFELFEKAINRKRKVKLIFKSKVILECIPLSITEINGKNFFIVLSKRVRKIEVSRLSGVEITDSKYIEPYNGDQVTIYTLKGNLAKRYELRENESIESKGEDSLTITNRNENKELLFSRLMRYQDCCEILKPKAYRDEFNQLITDTLSNYGIK